MSEESKDVPLTAFEYVEQCLQHTKERASLFYLVENFARYLRLEELSRLLVRHELFKKILNIKGSIVECGVYSGNGLMTWAKLSVILEPVAYWRKIYGFDTFEGFPSVSGKDSPASQQGDQKDSSFEELIACIKLFEMTHYCPEINKVQLIKGDFCETGGAFLNGNPHLLIALLYLDFDIYEPTKKALELFLPRMHRGSILCFDELNNPTWPGETLALLEALNIRDLKIEKFPFEPNISFIVLGD
jgi:hypothetical protein